MRNAGATPKLTTSTRLSSSAPNRVPVLERRATRPSSASRIPPAKMYHPARQKSPREASTIDQIPKNRLKSVNRLGTTMTARRMLGRGKGFMARAARSCLQAVGQDSRCEGERGGRPYLSTGHAVDTGGGASRASHSATRGQPSLRYHAGKRVGALRQLLALEQYILTHDVRRNSPHVS